MKKLYISLFIATLVVGIFLRFYRLGGIPDSLNWDEVSWGYNAYSILKTGHDEHGAFMPLSFKAFGDYKQPVYVYLTSLSVGLFGLNPFSVRFSSAFLGVLTIPFVWLLVFELFKKEKHKYLLSLAAMFFFAISPWSIQFSRVAYEANIGLFFVVSGAALFVRGLNTKKYLYNYAGILLLAISGYSYHSEKIFTPLLFAALLIWSYITFKVKMKFIVIFLLLFMLGNMLWVIDARTTARGRSVTFFSNQTQILQNSTDDIVFDNANNDKLGASLHNRRIIYFDKYLGNYLSHFDLNQLFVTGDNARHHAFGMGILYLVSLPFILIGLIIFDKKKYWIVLFWLFIAPAASALAVDAPNASRSLIFLPTWQIFEAVGVVYLLTVERKKMKAWSLFLISCIYVINFTYYFHNYFYHTNSEYGKYWQEGYKESVLEASKYRGNGKKVVFSSKFEQPYIFYLFYTKFDPASYIASGGSNRISEKCFTIENVYFGNCESIIAKGDILISQNTEDAQKYKKIRDVATSGNIAGVGVYESL